MSASVPEQAMRPDFLVIGAQKCGTTWLHRALTAAPGVFMPEDKELDFFTWQRNLDPRAFAAYRQRFARAAPGQIRGEATPGYFWTPTGSPWHGPPAGLNPDIPEAVRDWLGADCKFILALRHPVARAVSAYGHHIAMGSADPETPLLETPLELGIVDLGFYGAHLTNWLRVFPRERFLVVYLESDIAGRARETRARCLDFLGAADAGAGLPEPQFPGPRRWFSRAGVVLHHPEGQKAGVSWAELARLEAIYTDDLETLAGLPGITLPGVWSSVRDCLDLGAEFRQHEP